MRKKILAVAFVLLIVQNLPAQFFAKDDFSGWDKIGHVTAGAMGFGVLKSLGICDNDNLMISLGLGIGFEIKDSLMPCKEYGEWGGDGFSWRDIVADCVGIGAMKLLYMAFEKDNKNHELKEWRSLKKMMEAHR